MLMIDVYDKEKAKQLMELADKLNLKYTFGTEPAICIKPTIENVVDNIELTQEIKDKIEAYEENDEFDDFLMYMASFMTRESSSYDDICDYEYEKTAEYVSKNIGDLIEAYEYDKSQENNKEVSC